MTELPQELTITQDDLAGDYLRPLDCPLARALKREGVPLNYTDGYAVGGDEIICYQGDARESVGFYEWDTGEPFREPVKEGRLVFVP